MREIASKSIPTETELVTSLSQSTGLDQKTSAIFLNQLFGRCRTSQSMSPLFKLDNGKVIGTMPISHASQPIDYFIAGFTDYALVFYQQSSSSPKSEKKLSETAIDSMIIRHVKKQNSVTISSLSEIVPDPKTVIQSIERLKDKGLVDLRGDYVFYN